MSGVEQFWEKKMTFMSPHSILTQELKRKQKAHPSYSLRALARDLKVSSSYLSAVLKGKKLVPMHRLGEIAKRLEMDEIRMAQLQRAIVLTSVPPEQLQLLNRDLDGHRNPLENLEQSQPMSKADLKLWSQWYYLPILDLTTCEDFVSDLKWISRRLKVPIGDVSEAIHFLLEKGYLIEEKGQWKKTDLHLRYPCTTPNETIRNFHKEYLLKAIQVMKEQTSPEEFSRRVISGMIIASDPKKIAQARQVLETALLEASRILCEGECTELYQLGVQLYPLTSK
jgi:uncharacterized protein (TIGR02147 family)